MTSEPCQAAGVTAPAFRCPCCGMVSHNPNDLEGYCGACDWWTGDPVLAPGHLEAACEARTAALLREWRAYG